MREIAIGLIGVLLGGALATATALYLERRREMRASRVAARLIATELARAQVALHTALEYRRWWFEDPFSFPAETLAPLAERLDVDGWQLVTKAVARVRVEEGRRATDLASGALPTEDSLGSVQRTAAAVDAAVTLLEQYLSPEAFG